jgi:membrane associated rhomboid family serine protease
MDAENRGDETPVAKEMAEAARGGRFEPALNLPAFIVCFAVLLLAIQIIRSQFLSRAAELWVIVVFAFIPARYGASFADFPVPAAAFWTPLTYSFLHGGWNHLIVNLLWLVAFGSPLARRIGIVRITILTVLTSVAGAALHWVFYMGETIPMIGASAVVSGYMGAAARFAFQPGRRGGLNIDGPALSLARSFTDRRFMSFLAVWMALNFLFGSGLVPIAGSDGSVAWQAHVGGFLAGILAFSLIDRPPTDKPV